MPCNITIINYGCGNLLSIKRAIEYMGGHAIISDDAKVIAKADRVILPGVGSFGDCMARLNAVDGLIEAIKHYHSLQRPLLGICVGMQILFESSTEFGCQQGLGLVQGEVKQIPNIAPNGTTHKIPHVGWGKLLLPAARPHWQGTILRNIAIGNMVYFTHSYQVLPTHDMDMLAYCDYNNISICAAIQHNHISATQFHPEKSDKTGLKILQQFMVL